MSGGKCYGLIYWLVLICLLFTATAVKHLSHSSCFCPSFSMAVTTAVFHVFPPGAGKQCQTVIAFQRVIAWCLRKHPLPLLLLHSHCMACKLAWVFIFKDTAKLCKRSEGNIHHPRLVCWTSSALVVPSEARTMRIYIETSTAGQVASVNSELGSQVLGNTKDAAQHSDELNVFGQARCPKWCTLILTCFSSARNM